MSLKQQTLPSLFVLLLLFTNLCTPAAAAVLTVDVIEDGYSAMQGASWYMDRPYAKTYEYNFSGYDAAGYVKFDIESGLAGYTSDIISDASFMFYKTPRDGAGLAEVPVGTTSNFAINAFAGAYNTDPGYAGDTVTYDHTVITGNEWISIDITEMVKGWLDGTYANYGMEITKPGYDGYGWYWATVENDEVSNLDFATAPYLIVNTVPVPAAVWLLGSGLIGLASLSRRSNR